MLLDAQELETEYQRCLEQLRWTHTMLSLLIEEQGGVVTVSRKTLEEYDGPASHINVYEDIEGQTYIIEVAVQEEVVEQ